MQAYLYFWSRLLDHSLRFCAFKLKQSRDRVCPGDDSHYPAPRNHFDVLAIKVNNKEQKNDLFTDMFSFQIIKSTFLKQKEKKLYLQKLSQHLQTFISSPQSLEAYKV